MQIVTGKQAEQTVKEILDNEVDDSLNCFYPKHVGVGGYYKNELGTWTAFDNSDGDCWVEDFDTRKAAKEWLNIN